MVTVKSIIPQEYHPTVLGNRGCKVQNIQQQFSVTIKLPHREKPKDAVKVPMNRDAYADDLEAEFQANFEAPRDEKHTKQQVFRIQDENRKTSYSTLPSYSKIMPNIKLQSSDGEIFEVDVEIAKASVTIKTMLEDLGMDDDEQEVVPLPNVNSAILKKVIQWATYHRDDPPPPEDDDSKDKRTDDISSWDADFLKVDQGTLFELILAANYLDIKGLLDVTCKTVANMIKGKTPEEIRKTFNIKNDFTPSEEEQVRKENEWCEEK
ncbi:hypothetical protein NPIL_292461 [Nephila pilipes]|uniref:S-phase kinase-associated protein 1 n=7 Tax=Araneoidea TaxID=74975 RepID=A0A8X6MDI5_NEPPI|nr:hypothetical protein NPIL_292461 [Nephila pilipes]